jgi:hypothetical protein
VLIVDAMALVVNRSARDDAADAPENEATNDDEPKSRD